MKINLFVAALLVPVLFACNEHKTENPVDVHSKDTPVHSLSDKHSELALNDGKKWKLDEATRNNMDSIRNTIQAIDAEKDYTKAAIALETDANRLVNQCRMSGPDHDMLHVWLESFLPGLKQLKTASAEEQPIAFGNIKSLVEEFGKYFE